MELPASIKWSEPFAHPVSPSLYRFSAALVQGLRLRQEARLCHPRFQRDVSAYLLFDAIRVLQSAC